MLMKKLFTITLLVCGLTILNPSYSATANQDVDVESSGAILIKSQRQQKATNTNQSITIKKSGGIFIIIQRNINKFKCEDLHKEVTDNES